MMGDFSSRVYLPSAADLNLVKAELLRWLFFVVLSAWRMPFILQLPGKQILIPLTAWAQQR